MASEKRCFSMKEAVLFESKSTASSPKKHRFFGREIAIVNISDAEQGLVTT
ncbi:MAG: hypothetical protein IJ176_02230 [Prevotella sp.]|nr:hypothetical protein [Prevotella sp.]